MDGQWVSDVVSVVGDDGMGVVAWLQVLLNGGDMIVKVVMLCFGQLAKVVVVNMCAGVGLMLILVGFDGGGVLTVVWTVVLIGSIAGVIGVVRGDVFGVFVLVFEQQFGLVTLMGLQMFVGENGLLLVFWQEGDAVWTLQVLAGGMFVGAWMVISGNSCSDPSYDANVDGRVVVLFLVAVLGGKMTLWVVLRSVAGNWGLMWMLGIFGCVVMYVNIGVDVEGCVVALWDDGSSSFFGAMRIFVVWIGFLSAVLSFYNQVLQWLGDICCNALVLYLVMSGDGFGSWQCSSKLWLVWLMVL